VIGAVLQNRPALLTIAGYICHSAREQREERRADQRRQGTERNTRQAPMRSASSKQPPSESAYAICPMGADTDHLCHGEPKRA
jgi:hypothetical protein